MCFPWLLLTHAGSWFGPRVQLLVPTGRSAPVAEIPMPAYARCALDLPSPEEARIAMQYQQTSFFSFRGSRRRPLPLPAAPWARWA